MAFPDVKEDTVRADKAFVTEVDPDDEPLTDVSIASCVALSPNAELIDAIMLLESAFGSLYIVIS